MKIKLFSFLLLFSINLNAQEPEPKDEEININKYIQGSLLVPPAAENPPLVIFIAGSGPTNRNGNQSFAKNDSYKKLAHGLWQEGIASYRFDKRVFQAQKLGISENEMRFDDFVTDAISVLEFFRNREDFGKIIVLGHSQGSLVGMAAINNDADAFISIAGAGRPIDSIIVDQIALQMPALKENAQNAFSEIRATGSSSNYSPVLANIFRESVQAFMLSWMIYDPAREIAELEVPVLIINGTNDFQVPESEAQLLKAANPEAQLVLLEGMNHVLKKIDGNDSLTNQKSYNEPNLPLHPELIPTISAFIKDLE